jgi:hypothetical protein
MKKIQIKIIVKVILVIIGIFALYNLYGYVSELYRQDFFNHLFDSSASLLRQQDYDFAFTSGLLSIYRQNLSSFIFYTCIFISCLLVFIFLRFKTTEKFLWTVSWVLTATFSVAILAICGVAIRYASNHDLKKVISSKDDLTDFLRVAGQHTADTAHPEAIFIKTGLFIQSLQFTTANDVVITFYIWQKYEHNKHDTTQIDVGFVLPEATSMTVNQAYKKVYKDFTVYGWDVEATIRETFSYENYPFDFQNVWLRMWHKDFNKNIILIPDLEAYKEVRPDAKMGIEQQIVLPGWEITQSFFGYMYNDYNVNFGMPDYVGLNDFPELYYCVLVRRFVLTTFISELLPIITILFILFVCVVIAHDEAFDDFFKFNVMELLSLATAMVFVIILLQVDLRRKISSSEILYLEYYYFMLYAVIFGILFNYIMLNQFKHFRIIQYGDNILIKVALLPLCLGFILCITYMTFN